MALDSGAPTCSALASAAPRPWRAERCAEPSRRWSRRAVAASSMETCCPPTGFWSQGAVGCSRFIPLRTPSGVGRSSARTLFTTSPVPPSTRPRKKDLAAWAPLKCCCEPPMRPNRASASTKPAGSYISCCACASSGSRSSMNTPFESARVTHI